MPPAPVPSTLYRPSLSLLTDLYQLTMAYGYWKLGMARRKAVFCLFFRRCPFGGGFGLAAGLPWAVDLLRSFAVQPEELDYLSGLTGADGRPLFDARFLDYLATLRFDGDLDAVPEGRAVFPHEPLLRVEAPLAVAQILETALLNVVNFQTLVATKAARVSLAARGEPVLEFGLRRAQGVDGGLSASRAAYLGGCAATSNVLAGRLLGVPVRGTHAHSWVMSFEQERASFEAYAQAMPNNCVFLVDTYDTLRGTRRAAEVGLALKEAGHSMVGVRLDSGDLAALSRGARKILDEAGLPEARVVASNDLDEHRITSLKAQGARIDVWGVGTRLVTAYDQPALGGVYKLGALQDEQGGWQYKLKLSEQPIKVSNPGRLQVRRFVGADGTLSTDAIYDADVRGGAGGSSWTLVDPGAPERSWDVDASSLSHSDLLEPVLRGGELVGGLPDLHTARAVAQRELQRLPSAVRAFTDAATHPVGLERSLWELKLRLMQEARGR